MKLTLGTCILALAFALAPLSVSAGSAQSVAWADLIDAEAQVFEDPYRDLTEDQIDHLSTIVRSRQTLAKGTVAESDVRGIEARIATAEDALSASGIDANWLIDQRWIVAERREKAANAVNLTFDDTAVSISGFAIAAPRDDDGTSVVYLVEVPGMCSHMPPPPPNQMIKVRLENDWTPDFMHQPVSLKGRIHMDRTEQTFRVVDGDMPMKAAWRLEASEIEEYRPTGRASSLRSEWVESLRSKPNAGRVTTE